MNFPDSIKSVWANYSKADGRASRSEYGYWFLFTLVIQLLLLLSAHVFPPMIFVGALFGIATILPGINVSIRRLHDANLTGKWLIAVAIFEALFNGIWFLELIPIVILWSLKGTEGKNRFDDTPPIKSRKTLIFLSSFLLVLIALIVWFLIAINPVQHFHS